MAGRPSFGADDRLITISSPTEGYFDSAAHLKPLLHLWTLAVEEQFYLFAPLLLFGLWRLARRLRRGPLTVYGVGLGLVFIVSLIGCALFTSKRPEDNYAFFLMPLRAWEFVAGGALGVLAVTLRKLPKPVVVALAVVGLAWCSPRSVSCARDTIRDCARFFRSAAPAR